MRKLIFSLIVMLMATQAFAQRQAEFPRLKITFDGTAAESVDTDGWWLWRAAAAAPAVSAASTARIYFDGTNLRISENGTAYKLLAAAGTVSSVGLALPASIFTVSGSPVTTSGTLTGALATQTANTLFAGPTTGAAAAPTFRAMVLADIPDGLITFAKWASNSCAANEIPKRNAGNTAWICSADATSPGGTSWLTTGNTVANTTSFIGTIDNNPFDIRSFNTVRGTVSAAGELTWAGDITLSSAAANDVVINTSSAAGINTSFMLFANRTSTRPTIGTSQTGLMMHNGQLIVNEGGVGWSHLVQVPSEYIFQADSGPSGGTWTNMPAALTEYQGDTRHRIAIDLTNADEVRLVTSQGTAGATGCELRVEYSTNGSTWASLAATGNLSVTCAALQTANVPRGSWTAIATASKADVYVRLMGINGDGVADPIFQRIAIQVR